MTTTVQVNGDTIILNGATLTDVIVSAVKQGVSEVLASYKEDPTDLITLSEVAEKNKCSIKTIERKISENRIRVTKVGRNRCIFRKDVCKLFQP